MESGYIGGRKRGGVYTSLHGTVRVPAGWLAGWLLRHGNGVTKHSHRQRWVEVFIWVAGIVLVWDWSGSGSGLGSRRMFKTSAALHSLPGTGNGVLFLAGWESYTHGKDFSIHPSIHTYIQTYIH